MAQELHKRMHPSRAHIIPHAQYSLEARQGHATPDMEIEGAHGDQIAADILEDGVQHGIRPRGLVHVGGENPCRLGQTGVSEQRGKGLVRAATLRDQHLERLALHRGQRRRRTFAQLPGPPHLKSPATLP